MDQQFGQDGMQRHHLLGLFEADGTLSAELWSSRDKVDLSQGYPMDEKSVSRFTPDFYAAEVIEWRWLIYPWAILEDVSGFIRELGLVDASPERMQTAIETGYGVRIPVDILVDANTLARTAGDVQAW